MGRSFLGILLILRLCLPSPALADRVANQAIAQSSHAAGGALNYNVNGSRVKGWAVIASPVSYGSSGYQSFICNQNGGIYEKDLGPDTAILAREITLFDPDNSLQPVDAQDLPPRSK